MNLAIGSLGTDTGGSIRIPSAFCGIVGMKPTKGSVSTYGSYPLSISMDHIGPMTRDVTSNALFLNEIVKKDKEDIQAVSRAQEDFSRKIGQSIKNTIVGIPMTFIEMADKEIINQYMSAIQALKESGVRIKDIEIPDMIVLDKASRTVAYSEIYAHKKELIESKGHLLTEEMVWRIRRGEKFKAYEYVKALKIKQRMLSEFNQLFTSIDFIVLPTTPVFPPDIGQKGIMLNRKIIEDKALISKFTSPINIIGLPALSLQWGFSTDGLPIGIQIIGKNYDEANIYKLAYALEQLR